MQIVFLHFAFKVLLPNIVSSLSIFFLNVTDLVTTLVSCLITCPDPYNFWKIFSCPNKLPVSCPSSSLPLWFFLEHQCNFVMTPSLQNGFSSVQFSSVTQSCPTLFDPMDCSAPGFPVHHQCPELTQTHVHPVSDAIQSSHPLVPFSSCRQALPSSGSFQMNQLFASWPKYWSFSFSISPSNEHPGLISFRMDWLDPLAVQGTLKSLLQHHSSKASVLLSAFFIVQLSHPYMTTGKTIALARWTFVGKVMSLIFNMLSRLAITFLPRSKLFKKIFLIYFY